MNDNNNKNNFPSSKYQKGKKKNFREQTRHSYNLVNGPPPQKNIILESTPPPLKKKFNYMNLNFKNFEKGRIFYYYFKFF